MEIANQVMPFIRLTVDSPSLHENGYMPILDLEVKMIGNQVSYRFFRKSQSTPFVIPFDSAMPDNVKRNSLIQKGVTILKNTKRDVPWAEKAELLSRYLTYSMMVSGYPEKWRLDTIKAALTTYRRQCRRADTGAAPLHRPRGWDRAGRVRRKAMTRTSWYRPYSAVGFYPPTPGHVLRDRLQTAMSEEAARIGISVKVIETGGRQISSDLVKLNLTPCPMTNCWPCRSESETGQKGASHTKGSSLYRADCVQCLEEDGRRVAYFGETGYSGGHRLSAEHRSDILRGNTSNALAKHAATHPDRARDPGLFNVKVLGSYPSALYRQVAEGCELALATDVDQLMNSREEWHQPSLNRVTVTREVRQPRRRNNNNNTGNSSRQPGTN